MPAADGSEQGDGSIGSLELSLTPTQDVDGTEPVTHIEDVPFQLAAERERVAEKIERAKERRSKAAHDAEAPNVAPIAYYRRERRSKMANDADAVHDDDSDETLDDSEAAHVDSEAAHDDKSDVVHASDVVLPIAVHSSPVVTHRKRGVVRKKRMNDAGNSGSPRRSPRVSAFSSVDGSPRQSPRILNMQKASPLGGLAEGKKAKSKVDAGSSHFIFKFYQLT
jgi:hypothetical protein